MPEYALNSIEKTDLVGTVRRMYEGGHRLIQIGATAVKDGSIELNYSFGKDLDFANYRITVAPSDPVPSVSGVFWNAFLYENEIHDLFGVAFDDLVVDYRGHFYKLQTPTPYLKVAAVAPLDASTSLGTGSAPRLRSGDDRGTTDSPTKEDGNG